MGKMRNYLVVLSSLVAITGCTSTDIKKLENQVEVKTEVKEVKEELLTSIETSYLDNESLSYKTNLEFEHDKT